MILKHLENTNDDEVNALLKDGWSIYSETSFPLVIRKYDGTDGFSLIWSVTLVNWGDESQWRTEKRLQEQL